MKMKIEIGSKTWAGSGPAFRIAMVVTLFLVFGLAASALYEYRLLQAVAHLPAVRYEKVLSTECPNTEAAPATVQETMPDAESPPDSGDAFRPPLLPGLRCSVPLTPD